VREGIAKAGGGKTLADFDLAPYVRVSMGEDLAACRDAIRPHLALYIGGMGARPSRSASHTRSMSTPEEGENFIVIANFMFPSKNTKALTRRTLKSRGGRECDRNLRDLYESSATSALKSFLSS
jgi:hypothetical protein